MEETEEAIDKSTHSGLDEGVEHEEQFEPRISENFDSQHQLLLDKVLQKMLVLPRLVHLAFKQMTAKRLRTNPDIDKDVAHIGTGEPPVLMVLSREGPLRSGVLAGRCHMPEPVVSKILKNLERSGLIERNTDPDNRRVVWVSLTPKGRTVCEELKASFSSNLAEILGPLSNQQLEDLISTFTHLEQIVTAAEQRAAQAGNGKQANTKETSHVADTIK
jgi:DNA-binding MarR family transcriptional regulator